MSPNNTYRNPGLRRSARNAKKKSNRRISLIDLTMSPSPPPRKTSYSPKEDASPSTKSPSSNGEIGQRLDKAVDDIYKCLNGAKSNGGAVDMQQLEDVAKEFLLLSVEYKSGRTTRGSTDSLKTSAQSDTDDSSDCNYDMDTFSVADDSFVGDETEDHVGDEPSQDNGGVEGRNPDSCDATSTARGKDAPDESDEAFFPNDDESFSGPSQPFSSSQKDGARAPSTPTSSVVDDAFVGEETEDHVGDEPSQDNGGVDCRKPDSCDAASTAGGKGVPDESDEAFFPTDEESFLGPSQTSSSSSQKDGARAPSTPTAFDSDPIKDAVDLQANTSKESTATSPKTAHDSDFARTQSSGDSDEAQESSTTSDSNLSDQSPMPKQTKKSAAYEEDKENISNHSSNQAAGGTQSYKTPFSTPMTTKPASKPAKKKPTVTEQQDFVNEVLASSSSGTGSHYKVLDVASIATADDIKRAYKKQALKLHPDKNKAPTAAEAFRTVQAAYDILKSPTKRSDYNSRCNISAEPEGRESSSSSSDHFTPGSSSFNTLPPGTFVNVYDDQGGLIQGFNALANKYVVMLDDKETKIEAEFPLQKVCVNLRSANILPTCLGDRVLLESRVTHITYRASYHSTQYGGVASTTIFLTEFIVPNGTIVRLQTHTKEYNGKYGKVSDWDEGTMKYTVQLSSNKKVLVPDKCVLL